MKKMLKQKRMLALVLIAAMILASAATASANTMVTTTTSTPLYIYAEVTGGQHTTIPQGTSLTVISTGNAFYYVQYGAVSGYVLKSACNASGTGTNVSYYLTTTSYTSLYYSASTSAGTYGTIQAGQSVGVISTVGSFYYINYNGNYGYVLTSACSSSGSNPSGNASATVRYSTPLYVSADTNSGYYGTLDSGDVVTTYSVNGSFTYVYIAGKYGYVLTSALNTVNSTTVQYYLKTNASAPMNNGTTTLASMIATIPSDTSVGIISTTGSYYYVNYNGSYGYVLTSYFTNTNNTNYAFYATTNAVVSVYTDANSLSAVKTSIPSNTSVGIISTSGSFYYLYYDGYYGYSPTSYFNASTNTGNYSFYVTTNSAAGLYTSANSTSTIKTTIPSGTSLGVYSASGSFYYTQYGGNYGYVFISACNSSTGTTNTAVQYYMTALYATPLYSSANTSSVSYSTISAGTSVGIISKNYDGFYYVYMNGSYGYVLQSALNSGSSVNSNINSSVATYGTVAMGSTLYSSDSTTGTALGRVSNAGTVSIISQTTTGFYYVKVGNYTGYLQIAAVTVANDATVIPITDDKTYVPTTIPLVNPSATTTGVTTKKTATIGNCVSWVSLRESSDSSSDRLAKVTKDSTVTILDTAGSYTKVTYAGTTGYILSSYIV